MKKTYSFLTVIIFLCLSPILQAQNRITWDGSESNYWDNVDNWDLGRIPTKDDTVIVPSKSVSSNNLLIDSDGETYHLIVESNGFFSIRSDRTLEIYGDLTLEASNSQMNAFGGGGGSIASSSTGLILHGDLVNNGTMSFNVNTFFIFYGSSITNTGSITSIYRTPHSDTKYSIVGVPMTGITSAVFGEIVYGYDESAAYNPTGDEGLGRFNLVASGTSMTPGAGVFSSGTADVEMTGVPVFGDQTFALSYTDQGTSAEEPYEGFNLVANPYMAAIDVTELFSENSAVIEEAIWLWDDGGTDDVTRRTNADYLIVNALGAVGSGDSTSDNSSNWDGYLNIGQGFFVKALSDADGSNLTFTDNMIVAGNNVENSFFRKTTDRNIVKIAISDGNRFKQTIVGLSPNASKEKDHAFDAQHISANKDLQLYSYLNNNRYAIQGLPLINEKLRVKLGYDLSEQGNYAIRTDEESLSEHYDIILEDLQEQRSHYFANGSYSFYSEAGNDQQRFELVLMPKAVLSTPHLGNDLSVFQTQDGIELQLNNQYSGNSRGLIYNLSGKQLMQLDDMVFSNGKTSFAISSRLSQIVIIKLITEDQTYITKFPFKN